MNAEEGMIMFDGEAILSLVLSTWTYYCWSYEFSIILLWLWKISMRTSKKCRKSLSKTNIL